MKSGIELKGMRFHAFHGCLESEKKYGGEYLVDFKCSYDISKAALTDNLDDTLNYADIYEIVSEQMSQPSNLLENVAAKILNAIKGAFPQLSDMEIKVSKLDPPVGGPTQSASVTISL